MSRRFIFLSLLLGLVFLAAVTINCGSSSSSTSKGCTGGPYNLAGNWTLTVSNNGSSVSGPGVISSSGQALFFQTTTAVPAPGDTWVLPAITGTCSFSGALLSYDTPLSGGSTGGDILNGSVTSATSISANGSSGNSYELAASSPLTGSVAVPSGTMSAQVEGAIFVDQWQLTFSPTGKNASVIFNGSDGQGCTLTGSFTEQGTSPVFDVLITYAGCPVTGTVNGLGFESSSDYFNMNAGAADTYLYAVSSNGASVFEIFP